ncbi:MAG: hypothetical protein ACXWLM_00030 [Myxococcales bacterium]
MILALLLAASSPSIAPLTPGFDPQGKGVVGVEFALPGGGGTTIGATYFLADNMAARLDFGLDAVLSPSGTPATFSIGVGMRFYQARKSPVAIFLAPSLGFGRELIGTVADAAEFISLGGAVGVEYFFTDHLSAGGQLGLQLKFGNIGGPTGSSVRTELSTGTSALFASFYF